MQCGAAWEAGEELVHAYSDVEGCLAHPCGRASQFSCTRLPWQLGPPPQPCTGFKHDPQGRWIPAAGRRAPPTVSERCICFPLPPPCRAAAAMSTDGSDQMDGLKKEEAYPVKKDLKYWTVGE